jgi:hypothetical protein
MSDADFTRIRQALEHGQADDKVLSGRDYNERYWRSAKAALGRIARQVEVTARELEAFRVVLDETEER